MSRSTRQRIGILVLVVLIALFAGGCFGGGDDTTGSTVKTSTTKASGSGTTGGAGGLSDTEMLSIIDGLPDEFTQAYTQRPVVVLFYVPGNADDTSVLETLNRLKSSFDRYAFLIYDYKNPEVYGTLSQVLKVSYPPYLVLIDAAGYPKKVFTGYVDEGTLNQSMVNLGR